MDTEERKIAKLLVDDLLTGEEDLKVPDIAAKLTLHRTGFAAAGENTLRGRVVTGKHGALLLEEYKVEIIVRRRKA